MATAASHWSSLAVCGNKPAFSEPLHVGRPNLPDKQAILERIAGSHHVFKHPRTGATIVLPHPKKDLGRGLVRNIYKRAGWQPD